VILTVNNVSFSYGKVDALHHVNLRIKQGQTLCVMGPNGSGKSTLIDTILGIHTPKEGTILLDGKDLSQFRREEIAKHVAFIPQTHGITFPYTVEEAVLMGRTAYTGMFRAPSQQDRQLCQEALLRVGILELKDRPYRELSGGELRLVLLARALCQKAPLILMDEPTAHLDYRNEMRFLEILCQLCIRDGIAVLLATHSPEHAFYLESRGVDTEALFLKKGVPIRMGRPENVITEDVLADVYGVKARILSEDGQRAIMLQRSL